MEDFVSKLSQVVYQPEWVEAASEYLKTRRIDQSLMRYPCTLTSGDVSFFEVFRGKYPPSIFTDSLFMPITDIRDDTKLVGFDVRYLGDSESRIRYHKFKRSPQDVMMYYTVPFAEINPETPIIVTEGVMDAESLRFLGFPVISPLTAMSHKRFTLFLHGISSKVYFCYDNDADGRKALERIFKITVVDPNIQNSFKSLLINGGKDCNEVLIAQGQEFIRSMISPQMN